MRFILTLFCITPLIFTANGQLSLETDLLVLSPSSQETTIYSEIEINASIEVAWYKIAIEYVRIGNFHPNMDYSYANDKSLRYGLGAPRHCQVDERRFVKDIITEWNPDQYSYSYEMYASEGLPWRSKRADIGLMVRNGKTYLFHQLSYRYKISGLTGLKRKKMTRYNEALLQAYRRYIEASAVPYLLSSQQQLTNHSN